MEPLKVCVYQITIFIIYLATRRILHSHPNLPFSRMPTQISKPVFCTSTLRRSFPFQNNSQNLDLIGGILIFGVVLRGNSINMVACFCHFLFYFATDHDNTLSNLHLMSLFSQLTVNQVSHLKEIPQLCENSS